MPKPELVLAKKEPQPWNDRAIPGIYIYIYTIYIYIHSIYIYTHYIYIYISVCACHVRVSCLASYCLASAHSIQNSPTNSGAQEHTASMTKSRSHLLNYILRIDCLWSFWLAGRHSPGATCLAQCSWRCSWRIPKEKRIGQRC